MAFDTDLDELTTLILDAISGVESVVKDPVPSVQASGFHYNAVTMTISYWYPSSMSSGSTPTDGVIRAVTKAITDSSIELALPKADIRRGTPANSDGKSSTDPSSTDAAASSDDGS